jgi:hypothetical protein
MGVSYYSLHTEDIERVVIEVNDASDLCMGLTGGMGFLEQWLRTRISCECLEKYLQNLLY